MKKLALFLLLSATGYALPIGNPTEASLMKEGVFCPGHYNGCRDSICDSWSVRIGFYGDYVNNKHMRVSKKHESIKQTRISTNAAYLALNVWDRADFFTTLGASSIEITTPSNTFGRASFNDLATVDSETGFSWSVGTRVTFWEWGCLGIGGEAQYFHTCPDINFLRDKNSAPDYVSNDISYSEWQLGIGISYRINIVCDHTALVPYIGFKGGHTRLDTNNATGSNMVIPKLDSERDVGYAFGLSLLGANTTLVTVEGRFADEKALYINAQLRF